MNLDAGDPAREVRVETRQPLEAARPQHVTEAMRPDRVQPGIQRQHFPGVARRRVALENAGDVFTDAVEHERSQKK
jgi:hypothetical protein